MYDNNDQDILDQHVTRVFDSPLRSPGNISPSSNQFVRRKPNQESSFLSSGSELTSILSVAIVKLFRFLGTQSSMRASRSLPGSNLMRTKNFGSVNTDSGISLFCSDTASTIRNMTSSSCGSSSSRSHRSQMLPPETVTASSTTKITMEDARRFVLCNVFLLQY